MRFKVEKVANMVFISIVDCGTIFKSWNVLDFTERKLKNAIKKYRMNATAMRHLKLCFRRYEK